MTPQEVIDQQDVDLDQAAKDLKKKSASIVHRAELALLIWLVGELLVENGHIVQSTANLAVVRQIPARFDSLLQEFGFDAELKRSMRHFDQQIGAFRVLLQALGASPAPFSAADASYFQQRKKDAATTLLNQVAPVVEAFEDRARAALGSRMADLHEAVADLMPAISSRLRNTFSTEIMVFSRSVADRGYAILQASQPNPLNYRYAGPGSNDPVIRKFCEERMKESEHGDTWTRPEIDRMSNGQGLPVFTACGGHGCRHTWLAVLHAG